MDKAVIDCKRLLETKRKYREGTAEVDRLLQFKMAASLRESQVPEAIAGMMIKHDTQLYTMLNSEREGNGAIELKRWKETIYDSINYRLLLLAALGEEAGD